MLDAVQLAQDFRNAVKHFGFCF